jgi:hypothetical protein
MAEKPSCLAADASVSLVVADAPSTALYTERGIVATKWAVISPTAIPDWPLVARSRHPPDAASAWLGKVPQEKRELGVGEAGRALGLPLLRMS